MEIAQLKLPVLLVRLATAIFLLSLGAWRLFRSRHPRWAQWVGMRVGFRDLTLWSFLMASAHGAGLMLIPIILGMPGAGHNHHAQMMAPSLIPSQVPVLSWQTLWWMPVGIHTLGYLILTGLIAILVYQKLGLMILRQAWLNLDLLWALALAGTGALTLLL